MAKHFRVVAPMVYLKYHNGAGSVAQAAYLRGAVVQAEDDENPRPGQVIKASIDHHIGTEQIQPVEPTG